MSDDKDFHYYDNPEDLNVHIVIQEIMLSPEKMFVSPDGQRVYFLSNRPGTLLIRIDTIGQTNYKFLNPEEIREHVKFRLREAGMENEIDYQGPQVS